jgi:hypothetical protein
LGLIDVIRNRRLLSFELGGAAVAGRLDGRLAVLNSATPTSAGIPFEQASTARVNTALNPGELLRGVDAVRHCGGQETITLSRVTNRSTIFG